MTGFEIADKLTGGNEGGWANDPDDKGGETWDGIAYNSHPGLSIWPIIHSYVNEAKRAGLSYRKTQLYVNGKAKANSVLQAFKVKFYKTNYWDVNNLDLVKDQQVKNGIYDFGVNSGTSRAAKMMQETVNAIIDPDIKVDGDIGQVTIKAVNSIKPALFDKVYDEKRTAYYKSIAKGSQLKWLTGWLKRITLYK